MGRCRSGLGCPPNLCGYWLMLNKLKDSIKDVPINFILCIVVLVLYYTNNWFLKGHTSGIIHYLLVCHFNDFLGGVVFIAYTNVLLNTRNAMMKTLWKILLFSFSAGLFWEFVTPLIKKSSISDWIDVGCYVLGGFTYWLVLHIFLQVKKSQQGRG